jgi:arginine exporter protein ArgO
MKEFKNGLITGLTLQLAIGPVDGLAGVLAVTFVDYFYISLAIFGIGKLLENKKIKKTFGIMSSSVLIIFGLLILKRILNGGILNTVASSTTSIFSSFSSVLLITVSSPMTIVFFTSLFTAKAIEYGYTKKELLFFGLGTGFATFLFMGLSVILFSLLRGTIPLSLIMMLNGIVGCLLIGYGSMRLWKVVRSENSK